MKREKKVLVVGGQEHERRGAFIWHKYSTSNRNSGNKKVAMKAEHFVFYLGTIPKNDDLSLRMSITMACRVDGKKKIEGGKKKKVPVVKVAEAPTVRRFCFQNVRIKN